MLVSWTDNKKEGDQCLLSHANMVHTGNWCKRIEKDTTRQSDLMRNLCPILKRFDSTSSDNSKNVMQLFLLLWGAVRILAENLNAEESIDLLQNSSFEFLSSILQHKDFHIKGYRTLRQGKATIFKGKPICNQYSMIYKRIRGRYHKRESNETVLHILLGFLRYRAPDLLAELEKGGSKLMVLVYARMYGNLSFVDVDCDDRKKFKGHLKRPIEHFRGAGEGSDKPKQLPKRQKASHQEYSAGIQEQNPLASMDLQTKLEGIELHGAMAVPGAGLLLSKKTDMKKGPQGLPKKNHHFQCFVDVDYWFCSFNCTKDLRLGRPFDHLEIQDHGNMLV